MPTFPPGPLHGATMADTSNDIVSRLLEAGIHFGQRRSNWNPKMKPYIFAERNGIHIIDLQKTMKEMEGAQQVVTDTVRAGKSVLFVGTKKQAVELVKSEAERCG